MILLEERRVGKACPDATGGRVRCWDGILLFVAVLVAAFFHWLIVLKYDHENGHSSVKVASPANSHEEVDETNDTILHCRNLRGRYGSWIIDEDYAARAKYASPLSEQAGDAQRNFTPSMHEPFLPATMWRWEESTFPQCSIKILTLEGQCTVLEKLGIEELFFVGDSLTFMMVQSFWKLIGSPDDPGDQFNGFFHRSVRCEGNSTFEFHISFSRNDHLTNVTSTQSTPTTEDGWPICDVGEGLCWPWIEHYASRTGRTLFVANTGLHTHTHNDFRRDFDAFVAVMEGIRRSDDIVLFRTSIPGHYNCSGNRVPFINYTEYEASQVPMYDWEKVEAYNDYAKQTLLQLNRTTHTEEPRIDLLDVFPITVLRPDGHRPPGDCLHYYLPGPPDWWNHLLYSYLADLATET